MTDYAYVLHVDEQADGGFVAYLDEVSSPLRGAGNSPLEAIRALCETLKEWPIHGARNWLGTPAGVKLARMFVPDFNGSGGASS